MLPALGTGIGRVLITADAVGGVWHYTLDLASEYRRYGIDVRVVVLGPALSKAQRAEAASVPGLEVVETGLPLEWLAADPTEVNEAARQLAMLAAEWHPDIVHLNSPALAAYV